ETAPYFQDSIPAVSEAEISLEIEDQVFEIPEIEENSGIYKQQIPMIYEEEYKLTVKVNEEQYQGETYLYQTVPVDSIAQEEGFFDPEEVLLKIFFTDPAEEENYYLFSYESKHGKQLMPVDDEYFDGNQMTTLYMEEFDLEDSIKIKVNGTGKQFNKYISILLEQGSSNNPFATAPTTVRGNMINMNNSEKFPLGYFRISQQFETVYVVE